jgi:hypothetical protein
MVLARLVADKYLRALGWLADALRGDFLADWLQLDALDVVKGLDRGCEFN